MTDALHVEVRSDTDIVTARQKARMLAAELGFSSIDMAIIATAISELARNIVLYAKQGEIIVSPTNDLGRKGIMVVARDNGPGIYDIEQAMEPGYSTSRSLGMGLPGVKRLMDELHVISKVGKGTVVTAKKWNH